MSVHFISVESPSIRYHPRQNTEKEQAVHVNVLFALSHTTPTLSPADGGT
jgi:hypothetical protein